MEIKFKELECLKVGGDEVLIIKFPKETSRSLIANIMSELKKKYPDLEACFFAGDIELAKVKK